MLIILLCVQIWLSRTYAKVILFFTIKANFFDLKTHKTSVTKATLHDNKYIEKEIKSIQFKKVTDCNCFYTMFKPPPEKVLFIYRINYII